MMFHKTAMRIMPKGSPCLWFPSTFIALEKLLSKTQQHIAAHLKVLFKYN